MKRDIKRDIKREVKPEYYNEFHCIADKCSFTCCQEWNIAVDHNTYHDWENVDFDGKSLTTFTKSKEGMKAISLNEKHQCPFLTENKLCKLVVEHGDGILSDTCTTFPRQIHEFKDRMESSIVACCPEVVDILDRQDRIRLIDTADVKKSEKQSEQNDERDMENWQAQSIVNSDTKVSMEEIRNAMMNMIQNPELDVEMELMIIFDIMLEILNSRGATRKELRQLQSIDYLKKIAAEIQTMDFHGMETFEENNELYLDLVENYRKEGLYTRHLEESIQLALRLEENVDFTTIAEKLQKFQVLFKKFEKLFRNYLAAELFTNALIPDSDLESYVVMIQWITLEYVSMRHAIFLKWMLGGEKEIAYTDVRDTIVLISRITGYDQQDIFEYLDNSFQSRIWEWGYLALITGRNDAMDLKE